MAMARVSILAYFALCFILATNAHHADDSDYNELAIYDDMTYNYVDAVGKDRARIVQDDFYILSDFDDSASDRTFYPTANELLTSHEKTDDGSFHRRTAFDSQLNWYKPERVYRYTKHRIPGYDYDELDYMATRNFEQCDDRSVWTHCLCQFTCTEPDIVDCYTPCKSGCECKEEYVFDEKTQQCSLPEDCTSIEEDGTYNQ